MKLLEPHYLIKTGEVDHADWNYRPVLGWIQQTRFRLVTSFLKNCHYQRLLEVGYGSGIFIPELSNYCTELYGIDVHNKYNEVQQPLEQVGVKAKLSSGTIEHTMFETNFFDCVIAISALEFVQDIDMACYEINRVLKPNGSLIVVTPGHSLILDIALKMFTGESAKKDYGDRRDFLISMLLNHFSLDKQLLFPPVIGRMLPVYTCLKLHPV